MIRKLEIGPGESRLGADWVTVDVVERFGVVDHICRWGEEPLPFPDETFNLVYAAHVLEHVPWYQTLAALGEVRRILVPGGMVEIHVPDFDFLTRAVKHECCPDHFAEGGYNSRLHWMHWAAERLFHLGPDAQWHRACFNAAHLRWCLATSGFEQMERLTLPRGDSHGCINLGMSALKPTGKTAKVASTKITEGKESVMPNPDFPGESVPGAEDLPYCHSRREFNSQERIFFCAHPNVHAQNNLVTPPVCRMCDLWKAPAPEEFRAYHSFVGGRNGPCWFLGDQIGLRECASCRGNVRVKVYECGHPRHEDTTLDGCVQCGDYDAQLTVGSVGSWSVGITTAPRRIPTLQRTLRSLAAAGWQDPLVFAEPESPFPDDLLSERIVRRSECLGEWPNWLLGLSELYLRDPVADAYLMVQDDVLFCRNLRAFLDTTLWPDSRLGVLSLYNPLGQERDEAGFQRLPPGGLPGALALVFPNAAVRLFLSDPVVLRHRLRGPTAGLRLTDVVVGEWAQQSGWRAWGHSPSLCQHIGSTTTVWPKEQDNFFRAANSFVGEDFDAAALVGQKTST